MSWSATRPRRGASWALATVGALVVATAGAAVLAPSGAAAEHRAGTSAHYAINRPLCAAPKTPDANRCLGLRRVPVGKGTPDAYRYSPTANGAGPGGGMTPAQLAGAYGYNAAARRSNQLVAIIDWYDDPAVAGDLNHFDAHYHL